MFALVVGQLRPAVVSRTRWTSLQAHGSVVMTGDRSHPARLIDALPRWWHLNNNRVEIKHGVETMELKSGRSGNLDLPASRGGL